MTATINGVTMVFVGNHYEVTGGAVTKYYFAGGSRVAVRQNGTLYYLLSDHLGSTSLTTDASGVKVAGLRYNAWGAVRYADGATPAKYTYTGQYEQFTDSNNAMYHYGARFYDPGLMRFLSPDSIVPLANQGVQAFDRYAYVNNSPINFTDPSGYKMASDSDGNGCSGEDSPNCIMDVYSRYGDYEGMDDSLRSFIRRNPDYDPATDNNLNDFGRVIVSNAKFQVVVSNSHGNGTISLGLGGAIFALVGVTGSAGVAVDGNGNWGFILSFGGGGYDGIGISKIGPYFSTTNAPSLNDLNGFSVQLGGQVGDVASVGGEWVFFGGDKHYQGKTIAGGAALNLPIPFEIHATLVYSWVFPLNGWK